MRSEQDVFNDLETLCRSPGYTTAIGYFCLRDNVIRYADHLTAEDMEHQFSMSRLIRTEISTLLGLQAKGKPDFTVPDTETLASYIKNTESLLEELHQLMSAVMSQNLMSSSPDTDRSHTFANGDALREPIFYGGESAYNFQYRDFALRKYAEDYEWLKAKRGFSIAQAHLIVCTIGKIHSEKLNDAVINFSASPPTVDMLSCFKITISEIVDRSGLTSGVVLKFLESFSLGQEEYNTTFKSLHDFNLVNAKPIIYYGNDTYILFQGYSLEESLYESPFYWMLVDKGYSQKAAYNRGRFTEQFTWERLVRVFGSKNVICNVDLQQKKGIKIGEIDVLVLYSDRALVVQTKSKRLTLESRKGNDLQIRSDFQAAIQGAYDQAHLCATNLIKRDCVLLDSHGNELNLVNQIRFIYPICVVADHYPALAFQARQFLKSQVDQTIQSPLVTDVFAIDAITEFLETPLHFLSYIDRRSTFSEKFMMTHEMTILSFHLQTNLWIDDELDMMYLSDGISAELDAAMIVRREGLPGDDTPKGILTSNIGTPLASIIHQIEAEENVVAVSLGLFLLQLSQDAVTGINNVLDVIITRARRDGENHDLSFAFGKKSVGITIHCNNFPTQESREKLLTHCEIRKYSSRVTRWFGMVLRPENNLVRFCVEIDFPWKFDKDKERAVEVWEQSTNRKTAQIGKKSNRPGRNDPCPCGSGKKYKKCCIWRP